MNLELIGNPEISIKINNQKHQSLNITQHIDLYSDIDIEIELKNKDYNTDAQSAVVLKNLSVDEYSIIDDYIDTVIYTNDHNWKEPTTHIGFNGKWKLYIPGPFYISKHHRSGQGWLLLPI